MEEVLLMTRRKRQGLRVSLVCSAVLSFCVGVVLSVFFQDGELVVMFSLMFAIYLWVALAGALHETLSEESKRRTLLASFEEHDDFVTGRTAEEHYRVFPGEVDED
jgi:hypothetical protein